MNLFGIEIGGKKSKTIKKNLVSSQQITTNLEKFYQKPVTRVSVELVASIVIVMVFAIFALRPTLLTMSDLLAEIDQKRELDQALQEKLAALSTAQSEWQVYQDDVQKLQEALLTTPSLEEVLLYLEYLALNNNLEVTSVSAPPVPLILDKEAVQSQRVVSLAHYQAQFAVNGNYQDIIKFLTQIEQYQPLFSVDDVQLQVNENDPDEVYEMTGRLGIGLYAYTVNKKENL